MAGFYAAAEWPPRPGATDEQQAEAAEKHQAKPAEGLLQRLVVDLRKTTSLIDIR